ncbi:uncharacterized protein LOC128201411 [Galleria mellonella]|uniref:Uncharacterized protein LOC128201411 n=1 Tax=Galleria mellonella TaxID=7137 RepID=A0ABM3MSQ8_GALME|nr:uncharacterized protein LOC128201411 [Galleria mellonella]
MAINETWLRPGESGRAPTVPGYKLRHVPRPSAVCGGRGGGVAFYIRAGVNARVRTHPAHSTVEQMWLTLSLNKKKLLIGTAYRPPWLDTDIFLDAITESIASFAHCDNVVLLGDFNINLIDINESKYKKLCNFLNYCNLRQIIHTPTHFINDSKTLIDIICTDAHTRNVSVDHIIDLGHHSFLSCEILLKKDKPHPRIIKYRPFKDILPHLFEADLALLPWHSICDIGDVNDMVLTLNSIILQLFDLHVPIKTKRLTTRPTPWLTDNVKFLIKLRNDAQNKYRNSKLECVKEYYKELKRHTSIAISTEKKAYYNQYINNNINNSKKLWQNIKSDIMPSKTEREVPSFFDDPNEINKWFLNVPGENNVNISQLTFYEFGRFGPSTLGLKPVSKDAVHKIINNLKSNAQGNDGITLEMIKLTMPYSLEAITSIINKSILSGTFPEAWRTAIVRPIPKGNDPTQFKDLRPISILPCLSKILERVVYLQVFEYLETNGMLPDLQSGFRKKRSTATALSDVVDNILEARDYGRDLYMYRIPTHYLYNCFLLVTLWFLLKNSAVALQALQQYAEHGPTSQNIATHTRARIYGVHCNEEALRTISESPPDTSNPPIGITKPKNALRRTPSTIHPDKRDKKHKN